MSSIQIKKVANKEDLKSFIEFYYDLYAGNPYAVPNLYTDEWNTLSKDKNPAFEFCEAEYFIALKDNKIVGRVAAIINHKANQKWERKDVRFGWIDFIDDIDVSKELLNAVGDYGRSKGMETIAGPLGFTDMDAEGMLIMGFDQLGTIATNYNYDYYPKHVEAIGGWEKDIDYVEYKISVPDSIPEKLVKLSEMIQKRYNLHIKKLTKKEIFEGGYGRKIFELINNTYKDLYGFSELTERQIDQYIDQYFPYANLDFITVIEDGNKNNQIAGMGITIPSLSRALQKCKKGRLFPFGWWHLLKVIKFMKTDGVDLLLLGFLPEYRSKGANALLFYDLIPRYIKYGIKWGETQVEMETNNRVQSQWEMFDSVNHKRRRCYRKNL
ncbi:N-acetyltransferase [Prevotella aurantiaca]|uniref:N-acetyltransferase n=1 Tax=Prevotella aurantiaca TaxID=596085 RepID=UPI0028DB9577|nr:N-acetyltransferase [Prevotella aurantiaca]